MNTPTISILLTKSLAWALLYSLFQGLLIFIAVAMVFKAAEGVSARIKYWISASGFAAMFAWFGETWISQYDRLAGSLESAATQGAGFVSGAGLANESSSAFATASGGSGFSGLLRNVETDSTLVISLYALGLLAMLVRFMMNLAGIRRLKQTGALINAGYLYERMLHWQDRFGIGRKVRLLLSEKVNVPMMLGYARPVILLPMATFSQLSTEQLETILLHELAHIKRHDYLVNMLQVIGETVLFFNPFVWLISARIREQRELCCDDLVVSYASDPLPYANALAILESGRMEGELALAATGNKNQLLNRIKRIMEMKKPNTNYGQMLLALVLLLALSFSVAMINPSFAQKVKKTIKKTTTKKDDGSDASSSTTSSTTTAYAYGYDTDDSTGAGGNRKKVVKVISGSGDDTGNVDVHVSFDDGEDEGGSVVMVNGRRIKHLERDIDQLSKELNAVNWQKIGDDVSKNLKEVELELSNGKLKKTIEISIDKGFKEAEEALAEAGKELRKQKVAIAIASSGRGANRMEANGTDYEAMLNRMQKEGLIDRDEKFSVRAEGGELYINGEKQSSDVTNRYKRYLEDVTRLKLSGKKGNLSISVEKEN